MTHDDQPVTVVVFPDHCAATGACRSVAPDVFGADEDDWVTLLEPHPDAKSALAAANLCPVAAIKVFNAAGEPLS